MKTILVPTDFSEQANNALDFACQMAKKSDDTEVRVLHIIEGPAPGSGSLSTMGEIGYVNSEHELFIAQYLRKRRDDMIELVGQDKYSGINLSTDVQVGNPYHSISKTISDISADLVVMGTQGSSGLEEVLIGSNTEKVVRYSKCPVITIKQDTDLEEINDIVLATNLTEDQSRLVTELKKLQRLTNSKIHLLKVNTPNHFHTNRQIEEEFQKYVTKYHLDNYSTNIYNDVTEEDGVIRFTEDIGAGIIAMGTHGRTGLMHLLSGSIAEDLVNHSKIPVWTLSMKR